MPTIGFRMDSIRAERYSFEPIPQLNINMNIVLGKPTKKDGNYMVEFIIKIDCSPPIASIDVKGVLFISPLNTEEAKKIDEDLSKSSPPQPIVNMVFSYTLPIIAFLSRELGLPPPIQIALPFTGKSTEGTPEYHM
ncbi:MAG: hypothetical protein QXL96_04765 [Ignisphaera sp.]